MQRTVEKNEVLDIKASLEVDMVWLRQIALSRIVTVAVRRRKMFLKRDSVQCLRNNAQHFLVGKLLRTPHFRVL
jgi:hypothetical protein